MTVAKLQGELDAINARLETMGGIAPKVCQYRALHARLLADRERLLKQLVVKQVQSRVGQPVPVLA